MALRHRRLPGSEREPFNTTQGMSHSYSEIADHPVQSRGPSAPSYRATPGGPAFGARSDLLSILTIKLPPHQLVNNKKVLSS
jgi:hypothetical protein